MEAVVRQMDTEEELGEPVTSTQRMLHPREATEMEMKVHQPREGEIKGRKPVPYCHWLWLQAVRARAQNCSISHKRHNLYSIFTEIFTQYLPKTPIRSCGPGCS